MTEAAVRAALEATANTIAVASKREPKRYVAGVVPEVLRKLPNVEVVEGLAS